MKMVSLHAALHDNFSPFRSSPVQVIVDSLLRPTCYFEDFISKFFSPLAVDPDEVMSSRFDKRLKEAGLLDLSGKPEESITQFSSTEDIVNMEDPGYALLTVQPTGPVMGKTNSSSSFEDDGGYACPADALLAINPHMINLYPTPSPPTSPMVLEPALQSRSPSAGRGSISPMVPALSTRSPSAGRGSPYESVNDIRRMREKQIKDQFGDVPAVAGVSPTTGEAADDDQCGYSRPFDALKKYHLASDASSKKPLSPLPFLRTSSGGKEASARALHHVVSPSSSKGSLDGVSDLPPRSASTSVITTPKIAIKPPLGNGGSGGKRSPVDLLSPVVPKHGNQTLVDASSGGNGGSKVSRYILQVESSDSRAEIGRTQSIDSALYTPAKVTKLRNGRDRVTLISGKSTVPSKPKPSN